MIYDQLQSCPFCGANNLIVRMEGTNSAHVHYWVECEHCGTSGPTALGGAGDPMKGMIAARDAWNNRWVDSLTVETGSSAQTQTVCYNPTQ